MYIYIIYIPICFIYLSKRTYNISHYVIYLLSQMGILKMYDTA